MSKKVLGRLYKALVDLAQEKGIRLVVDKSAILYGQDAIDLTDALHRRVRGLPPRGTNFMNKTLAELAERTGGTCRGEGSTRLTGAAGLGEAGPGDISFLANKKYANQLATSRAGAVIVSPDVETGTRPALVHPHPSLAWAKILELLDAERTRRPTGVHPTAVIAPTAKLGKKRDRGRPRGGGRRRGDRGQLCFVCPGVCGV